MNWIFIRISDRFYLKEKQTNKQKERKNTRGTEKKNSLVSVELYRITSSVAVCQEVFLGQYVIIDYIDNTTAAATATAGMNYKVNALKPFAIQFRKNKMEYSSVEHMAKLE